MSYDLHLFRPLPGLPYAAAYEQHLAEDERQEAAAKQARLSEPMRKKLLMVCAELASRDQALRLDESPSHIGLLDRAGGDGIEFTFFHDDCGEISIADWADETAGRRVLQRVWGLLSTVHERTGMVAFDPQAGIVLDPASGRDALLNSARASLQSARRGGPEEFAARPWWKFW